MLFHKDMRKFTPPCCTLQLATARLYKEITATVYVHAHTHNLVGRHREVTLRGCGDDNLAATEEISIRQ